MNVLNTVIKSLSLAILFTAACGGGGRPPAAAGTDADNLCPNTPANIRAACGCRPTEQHYVSSAAQLGTPSAKEAAIACATGTSGADGMPKCMQDKGVSGSTMALMGKPVAKDDTFEVCIAKTP